MLRAVANPAAGGQPGSFTSLTATSLTVNGNSTLGLGDFSSTTTVNGALSVVGGAVQAFNGGFVAGNNTGLTWNGNGGVGVTFTAAGSMSYASETGQGHIFNSYIAGSEQTAPAAPAANGYRIFAQDNGAGKTQLMVIFASGSAQQIAIEP